MKASEFMNREPVTISPDMGIVDVIRIIRKTKHDSFPVIENGKVVGMLTYADIILQPLRKDEHEAEKEIAEALSKKVRDVMQKKVVAIPPEMGMNAIARLMFRSGYSRLPVVDNDGRLLGLITNTDVIRAHIERVSPVKVESLKRTLENLHNIKINIKEENVQLDKLIPTEDKIYMDELKAREYEIMAGLAEPLLVVKNGEKLILIDGHHRAIAAKNLNKTEMPAYVLVLEQEIELGLEQTAEKMGLKTLDDIKILDGLSPYALPIILENGVVKKLI